MRFISLGLSTNNHLKFKLPYVKSLYVLRKTLIINVSEHIAQYVIYIEHPVYRDNFIGQESVW